MTQFGNRLALATLLLLSACSRDGEQEAQDLVNSFYQAHQAERPRGALSLKQLITFRHFLSVPLFEMLKDVSVAEEAHLAQTDDQTPPLVDGDLFTTHPRGATSFRLLSCDVDDSNSNCLVEVMYNDINLAAPLKSIDRVVLVRETRGWVINNIAYGSATGSGLHQGDLQKNLQTILANNGKHLAINSAK